MVGSVPESLITFDQDSAPPPAFAPEKKPSVPSTVSAGGNSAGIPMNIPPPITSPPTQTLNQNPPTALNSFSPNTNVAPNYGTPQSARGAGGGDNFELMRRIEDLERRLAEEVQARRKLEEFVYSKFK